MDRRGSRRSMWVRPWLIALAVGSLTACQGTSPSTAMAGKDIAPAAASWRVVERLGQARYLSPSMSGWQEIEVGSILPAGSQISTGIGGRLILAQAGNQMIAGTTSRFILPGWQPGDHVRQTAGWMRYRIADARSSAFEIETPFLDLAVADAVLDVTVADSETEVAVVSGRVHVKTLDDRRQIDLKAGHVGYASLDGHPLALRRSPGATLEPVPLSVIPALHPERPDQGSTASGSSATEPARADLPLERGSQAAERADPRFHRDSHDPQAAETAAAAQPATVIRRAAAQTDALSSPARLTTTGHMTAETTGPASARLEDPAPGMILASTNEADTAPAAAGNQGDVQGAASVKPGTAAETDAEPQAAVAEGIEPRPADRLLRAASAASQPTQPSDGTAAIDSPDPLRQRFDLLTEGLLDGLEPVRPLVPGARR